MQFIQHCQRILSYILLHDGAVSCYSVTGIQFALWLRCFIRTAFCLFFKKSEGNKFPQALQQENCVVADGTWFFKYDTEAKCRSTRIKDQNVADPCVSKELCSTNPFFRNSPLSFLSVSFGKFTAVRNQHLWPMLEHPPHSADLVLLWLFHVAKNNYL
jgi:hypothetical protein